MSPGAALDLNTVLDVIFHPAFTLLPAKMRSPDADALLLTIGLQESRFENRIQLVGNHRHWWESLKGPARGWPQFERAGIAGVLQHRATRAAALDVLDALRYPPKVGVIYRAIAHNDLLAACFARLLLWTDPRPLPGLGAPPAVGWAYYLRTWRPGNPRRETWDAFWLRAATVVKLRTAA